MKRTRIYRDRLKLALPLMAFVGAGLMIGCHKSVDDPYAGYIDPVKVLSFGDRDVGYDAIQYDNVMKYANDPRIEQIIYFLDSTYNNNNYTGFLSDDIPILRGYLQERLDYTPKATGAGTFIFRRGCLSVEDSLWFVEHGWSIRIW